MKCRRCGDICETDEGTGVIANLFYDYEVLLCSDCLDDYVVAFMSQIAEADALADVFDAYMRRRNPTEEQVAQVGHQSKLVHAKQMEIIHKVIKWVRDGNTPD